MANSSAVVVGAMVAASALAATDSQTVATPQEDCHL